MEKPISERLSNLLKTNSDSRDESWEATFLQEFPKQVVTIDSGVPSQEFDGWPYLHVSSTQDGAEPVSKLIHWLSERGIGLILNSHKATPDYVFTYGMLWSFRSRGSFTGNLKLKTEEFVFDPAVPHIHGPPSEEILPIFVRKVLKQFFLDQGIIAPKILVLSDDKNQFDFCFSIESLGYPTANEQPSVLEALSWFFPPDYSLVLVREEGLPPFHLLS